MAQIEIEQWAQLIRESEEADKAYGEACEAAMKEAEEALNDVELGDEDEVIDPASLGFINSEGEVAEDDLLDNRPHNNHLAEEKEEDSVDLAECGFAEDGEELAVKKAKEELKEAFHSDDDYASIELDIDGTEMVDGDNMSFEEALRADVPDVMVRKSGIGAGGVTRYRISGFLKDLKEAYAFYLGLYSWRDVEKQGEDEVFNSLVVFQDGDTLEEADYREAIAHVFDPIGVKASTANLKKTNVCQLSIVKEAVKAEIEKRKKALVEADVESMSDEELEDLDNALEAGEAVDNGEADAEDEKIWLSILKSMGINSIEEYKAMDPAEFEKRFEKANQPLDSANGFARSKNEFVAHHAPDKENGGATETRFAFNPDYDHRVTRAEQIRNAVKAEKAAREKQPVKYPKKGQDTWSLNDFGNLLNSLGPAKAKQLQRTMLQIAHEDNVDDPEAEAREVMFIKKLFGQKVPTFRDIARAWYPGIDPDERQQSVNKFYRDTKDMFMAAASEAAGKPITTTAAFSRYVLANERVYVKFLAAMKKMSDKRAANKRSIINMGKSEEGTAETTTAATPATTPAEETVTETEDTSKDDELFDGFFGDDGDKDNDKSKYFVVVMKDKETGEASFTFVEAKDEKHASEFAKDKYPKADVVMTKEETHDASSILNSLGLSKSAVRV